jgi:hypothetical protein
MSVKKKLSITLGLLIVVLAGYFATYGIRTTRPENLQRLISENVKVGASPEDVTRFLDQQGLDHSALRRTSEGSERKIYGDVPMIGAIKRHTWRGLLMFESIQVVFIFDDNNHLLKFDLHKVYTGL